MPGLVGAGVVGILVSVTVGFFTVWLGVGVGVALALVVALAVVDGVADALGLAELLDDDAALAAALDAGASGAGAVSSVPPQAVTRASRVNAVKEYEKRFML